MYRKLIKREWFHVFADDSCAHEVFRKPGPSTGKYKTPSGAVIREIYYRELANGKLFHVYSDDGWTDITVWGLPGLIAFQLTTNTASLRGFMFHGTDDKHEDWKSFIYGVVSFKGNTIEHIEGCFGYNRRFGDAHPIYPMSSKDWFQRISDYLKKHGSSQRDVGCWPVSDVREGENFDVENDAKMYYIFGRDRFEFVIPSEVRWRGDNEKLLEFARNLYAASKIPRICVKAVKDCESGIARQVVEREMYRELIKHEWFRVYSDDGWTGRNAPGLSTWKITTPTASLRGILFDGAPCPWWCSGEFIYGVVSFKENTIEHIEGCFCDSHSSNTITPMSHNHHWFKANIECLRAGLNPEYIGWKSRYYRTPCERFDVEKDRKMYYIFGDNPPFELNLPDEGIGKQDLLEFARNQYAASKIPRICVKAAEDCEVYCY